MENEIDIADRIWDPMFSFLSGVTNCFYFLGCRFNYIDKDYESNLYLLSESTLYRDDFSIIYKINQSSLLLNRARLSKFWGYYESPAIIFFKDSSQEQLMIEKYSGRVRYVDFNKEFVSGYMIYQSFELDVLWVKSSDLDFPVKEFL